MRNEMLNKQACPRCGWKTMVGFRQGAFNPNPRSKKDGRHICMNCFMDEQYARAGVEH